MNNLLLSGKTSTISEWDIQDILGTSYTREEQSIFMDLNHLDNTIGPYCNGMTYYEIEQLNNVY